MAKTPALPAASDHDSAHQTLDRIAWGDLRPRAVVDLCHYFHSTRYSGRRFERLAGGGDRPDTANRLIGDDLAALTLLSIHLRSGNLVIELLETHADQISQLLTEIPRDLAMPAAP